LRDVLPKVKHVEQHHAAMPWQKAPEFYGLLSKRTGSTAALALRLIMLSGLRSQEGRAPEWSEFDSEAKTWTVPAQLMKDGITGFIVPLTQPMLDILETMRGADPILIFPSDNGKPLSVNAFRALYQRMNADLGGFTTHGFRSMIADFIRASGGIAET
jgi:integrase